MIGSFGRLAKGGCSGLAMDARKRDDLKAKLSSQPEPQLVPIDVFFNGNDDAASIGCNLFKHPGIDVFRRILLDGLDRADVVAV